MPQLDHRRTSTRRSHAVHVHHRPHPRLYFNPVFLTRLFPQIAFSPTTRIVTGRPAKRSAHGLAIKHRRGGKVVGIRDFVRENGARRPLRGLRPTTRDVCQAAQVPSLAPRELSLDLRLGRHLSDVTGSNRLSALAAGHGRKTEGQAVQIAGSADAGLAVFFNRA
jgi:hypothetical protein